jgi:non-canonical purine NTP pyrophosphatase (RdgB/HAM1 family)
MMKGLTFITGNPKKAKYAAELLGMPVEHIKMDLPEIQSLQLEEVIECKLAAAYSAIGKPVFCEDVALHFDAMGRLPGPFIKFFLSELGADGLCRLLDGKSRDALARCIIGYQDADGQRFFEGALRGTISEKPVSGGSGFGVIGWDDVFIPEGYDTTRGNLTPEKYDETYLKLRRFDLMKEFLQQKGKGLGDN